MNIKAVSGLLLLLSIIAIPIFGHLDALPIQEWDESRLAHNSLEMLRNPSNIFVTTFDYAPDMWNTKPPLMIWLQVISMKVLGVNELAIRMPSAIAAVLLFVFLYWFVGIKLKKPWLAIVSSCVLITTEGYVRIHGIRTGDYDSLLTLLITVYCGLFYLFLLEKRTKFVYLSFLVMALAVLTKGVAALLIAPALFLYFLYKKEMHILRSPHLYLGIVMFAIIALGYYLLREYYTPGFIKAVQMNELGGRFAEVNEMHAGPWDYYFEQMRGWTFKFWVYFIPLGIYFGLKERNSIKDLTVLLMLLSCVFLVVISASETKLDWYDMPVYPWLSIIVGVFIWKIFNVLASVAAVPENTMYKPLPYLFLIFVFLHPYLTVFESVANPKFKDGKQENINMGLFLKQAKEGKRDISGYILVWDEYTPNLNWYLKAYSKETAKRSIGSWEIASLKPGTKIALHKDVTNIEANYKYLSKHEDINGISIYTVNEKE